MPDLVLRRTCPGASFIKLKNHYLLKSVKKHAISASRKAAEFKGESLSSGPYVVVSPYSAVQEGSVNSEILLTLPGVQKYVPDSYDPACFICAGAWADGRSFTGSMPVSKNSDL